MILFVFVVPLLLRNNKRSKSANNGKNKKEFNNNSKSRHDIPFYILYEIKNNDFSSFPERNVIQVVLLREVNASLGKHYISVQALARDPKSWSSR